MDWQRYSLKAFDHKVEILFIERTLYITQKLLKLHSGAVRHI